MAQLDSASVFGTEGCRFESYRACLLLPLSASRSASVVNSRRCSNVRAALCHVEYASPTRDVVGPRNISTAMMRSWGQRHDTVVCDEPLYAHYLRQTGLEHPGSRETLGGHESDWQAVVDWLTGPLPMGK